MIGIRETLCYEIARRMLKAPPERNLDRAKYAKWRDSELQGQWKLFDDGDILEKDVLDFGCGSGALSFHVLGLGPRSLVGVELDEKQLEEAKARAAEERVLDRVRFVLGSLNGLPFEDETFDTILAFDCVEHVMEVHRIFADWNRVLRPGGKVLIWWSPYRSPYGPHMEGLVPIPWAHLIFGQRAMIHAAARIYDSDRFVPMAWNLDERGNKKPNQWKRWTSFKDQGYINELTLSGFIDAVHDVGLDITRLEAHSFSGTPVRRLIGGALVKLPVIGEYMTSYYVAELMRPR